MQLTLFTFPRTANRKMHAPQAISHLAPDFTQGQNTAIQEISINALRQTCWGNVRYCIARQIENYDNAPGVQLPVDISRKQEKTCKLITCNACWPSNCQELIPEVKDKGVTATTHVIVCKRHKQLVTISKWNCFRLNTESSSYPRSSHFQAHYS